MSVQGDVHSIEEPSIVLPSAGFVSIQSLPQEAVEVIMSQLEFCEVCRLGTVCKLFRRAAISVQCTALRNLVPQILKFIMDLQTAAKDDTVSLQEHLQNAFLQTVLLILLGEARMFSATYLRYLQQEPYANIYPAGSMLDELYYVLEMARTRKISRELEPEMSTRLLTRSERFYDIFEEIVEPALVEMHTETIATPICVKLMDVLDCCQTSNFRISVTHNSGKAPFQIAGYYELRDFNTLETPPKISDDVTKEGKLHIVLHYLRNTVRWNNIFHPLRALWELDETVVCARVPQQMVMEAMTAYKHRCNTITSQLCPSSLLSKDNCYGIQQGSTGTGPCRQEFTREMGDILGQSSEFGLTCNIKMCVTDSKYLPTEYEFLIEPGASDFCSLSSIAGENVDRRKYPSPVSSWSIITPFLPTVNNGSSSQICLTAKDTLSRVSEILSTALKKLDKRARRFDIISKSWNFIDKETTDIGLKGNVKSDGWIHRSLSSLGSADEEVNKISSNLEVVSFSKSSSEDIPVKESVLIDKESDIVAVGSSIIKLDTKSSLESSLSGGQARSHGAFHFAIRDFHLEMRVWRPMGSQSNLSKETVVVMKQSSGNKLDFSQDEIVTSRN